MISMGIWQLFVLLLILSLLSIPLGKYIAWVFSGEAGRASRIIARMESVIFRLCSIDTDKEMNWKEYTMSLLLFNLLGLLVIFGIEIFQGFLPLNPQGLPGVAPLLAFNTAVSFVTNTNWQAYAGETTMSYFTQMTALTVQNFLSAGTGLAVAVALIRGIIRQKTDQIGNYWVDLTRGVLWVLIPISLVLALFLVSQGVIQNFDSYLSATTVEGLKQVIAMGPVASQEAIKELGTNGGGFFNANSAHPFENPNPLTNFVEIISILLIPAALPMAFGYMAGNRRQGITILAAMLLLFCMSFSIAFSAEYYGNPQLTALGVEYPSALEGKEIRFGVPGSTLFTVATTAASCGAVNNMHDSMTPVGGLIPLLQILLGEVVFGGVGAGFYGIMVFVLFTVFIIGLMVGRTPEYLGKKIETWDIKMATLAILIPTISILMGTAVASVSTGALSSVLNAGPHGFTEMLYAFASAGGNNGSAFAGLNANTAFWNIGLAVAMIAGRYGVIIPVLAVAGNLAGKQAVAASAGTFQTTSWLFPVLLASVILIIGALTFFPALALGPIVEQLTMLSGGSF